MSFIARKKCSFGGVDYLVGDVIPHDAVLPERVRSLIKSGTIAEAKEEGNRVIVASTPTFKDVMSAVIVPIMAKEGRLDLEFQPEDVTFYFEVAQMNAEEAIEAIGQVHSQDVLIALNVLDPRKTVKAAAEARGKELAEIAERLAAEEAAANEEAEAEAEQVPPNEPESEEPPQEGGEA